MKAIFTITYLACVIIAPVFVVVIVKEFYKFFTQDLDEFDQWQHEYDCDVCGITYMETHNCNGGK